MILTVIVATDAITHQVLVMIAIRESKIVEIAMHKLKMAKIQIVWVAA
jgi:hypothetical protein